MVATLEDLLVTALFEERKRRSFVRGLRFYMMECGGETRCLARFLES